MWGTHDSPMPKIPRRRWRIAFLLAIGVLVNYFDRVNLSVAHAALITTFAISNITFGFSPPPITGPMPCASFRWAWYWTNSACAG
jgi:hypothetical protein